jgi:hypothetical protein
VTLRVEADIIRRVCRRAPGNLTVLSCERFAARMLERRPMDAACRQSRGPVRFDRAVAVFHPRKVFGNCPNAIGHR